MIRCAFCGATHPLNTQFCDECGFALSEAIKVETDHLPTESSVMAPSPAPLSVAFSTRDGAKQFECALHKELLIGRADKSIGSSPDIDLARLKGIAQGVSRRHARLMRSGHQVLLEDLNSLNGTFVRGTRLAAHQAHAIQPGDELQFGKVILLVNY